MAERKRTDQVLHPFCRTVQSRHRRAKARVLTRAMSGPLHYTSSDGEKDDEEGEEDDGLNDADPEVHCLLSCRLQHEPAGSALCFSTHVFQPST